MSDQHQQAAQHLGSAAAKLALPSSFIGIGWFTLNDFALVVGAIASIAVAIHTVLKIYWDWRDRQAGLRGED